MPTFDTNHKQIQTIYSTYMGTQILVKAFSEQKKIKIRIMKRGTDLYKNLSILG